MRRRQATVGTAMSKSGQSRRLSDVGMSASRPTTDVSLRRSEPTLWATTGLTTETHAVQQISNSITASAQQRKGHSQAERFGVPHFLSTPYSRAKGIQPQFPHGIVSSVSFVSTTNTARSLAGFVSLALALTLWRSPGSSEKLCPAS